MDFAAKVEGTLEALTEALREGTRLPDDLPDLRDAWTDMQLVNANQPDQAWSLISVETDRIATSLNTLRELVVKWNKIH